MREDTDFYLVRSDLTKEFFHTELSKEAAEKLIPVGDYCYIRTEDGIKPCPFWDNMLSLPYQSAGFCHFLKEGDFTKDGTFLLWDQCKECGVNYGD